MCVYVHTGIVVHKVGNRAEQRAKGIQTAPSRYHPFAKCSLVIGTSVERKFSVENAMRAVVGEVAQCQGKKNSDAFGTRNKKG